MQSTKRRTHEVPVIDAPIDDPWEDEVHALLNADPYGDGPSKAPKTRQPAKPYDPGTAKGIRACGQGQYEVQSFREEGTVYLVDLNARQGLGSCTCPHYRKRIEGTNKAGCKHGDQARAEAVRSTKERAAGMSVEELRTLLLLNGDRYRPEIKAAIAAAIAEKSRPITFRPMRDFSEHLLRDLDLAA